MFCSAKVTCYNEGQSKTRSARVTLFPSEVTTENECIVQGVFQSHFYEWY